MGIIAHSTPIVRVALFCLTAVVGASEAGMPADHETPEDGREVAGTTVVLELPAGPGNPRNSEGSFVALKDGRILFAYSRYRGAMDWADHATADIAARTSADGGRTWSQDDRIIVPNEGRLNVMSASLLRLADGRVALFYLRKNG